MYRSPQEQCDGGNDQAQMPGMPAGAGGWSQPWPVAGPRVRKVVAAVNAGETTAALTHDGGVWEEHCGTWRQVHMQDGFPWLPPPAPLRRFVSRLVFVVFWVIGDIGDVFGSFISFTWRPL